MGRASHAAPPLLYPPLLSDSSLGKERFGASAESGEVARDRTRLEPELRDNFDSLCDLRASFFLPFSLHGHPRFHPASSGNPSHSLRIRRGVAQHETPVTMSGYQGKKNIPRITVSVRVFNVVSNRGFTRLGVRCISARACGVWVQDVTGAACSLHGDKPELRAAGYHR